MSYEADLDDGDNEDWYNHYEGEDCDHEDYSITWEGRCECGRCSHSWWATPAQIEANAAFESEYAEGEAKRYRQENVWWRKVLNFILRK